MKKIMKRCAAALMCVFAVSSLFTLSVTAKGVENFTNSKGTITVTCGEYKKKFTAKKYKKNFSAALNEALDYARKKSTAATPATVKVSKGYYSLDRTIKIYSDTTLVAKGCYFRHYGNLIRNGYNRKAKEAAGYSGAKNITIDGGTWDAMVPYSEAGTWNTNIMHSTMRFGHCKNITVKNCTFVGNYNCHDVELGGVQKAKITKCSFSNIYPVNTFPNDGGREAIQIDLATSEAMPEFVQYDKTQSTDITVSYNTFKNKFRGVGSHHAVPGRTYNNIKVHHNTFESIGGIAIYAVYWTNSKIYENKMTDVGLGIDMRQMVNSLESMNFKNLDDLSYEECEQTVSESYNYIHSNTIHLRGEDNSYTRACGIRVMGESYSEYQPASNINAGVYHIYNVIIGQSSYGNIKPNVITGNIAVGIQLNYGVNSIIRGNSIDMTESVSETANGIEVKGCRDTIVSDNSVSNGFTGDSRGIYLTPTAASEINENVTVMNNTVSSCQDAGVLVNRSSSSSVFNNTITNCTTSGIAVKASSGVEFSSNYVKGTIGSGLYVYGGSTDTSFISNEIDGGENGAYLLNSNNTSLKENTITNITKYGVNLRASNSDTITANTITSESYAVRMGYGCDGTVITDNSLSSVETECIYYVGTNDPDKTVEKTILVTGNTFSCPSTMPDVKLSFANVAAEIYDNKNVTGEEVTIRAKGDSDKKYKVLRGQTGLDTLTSEQVEDATLLSWITSDAIDGVRVYSLSEEGRTLLGNTSETSFSVPTTEPAAYEAAPYNSFTEIKVVGVPMTVE